MALFLLLLSVLASTHGVPITSCNRIKIGDHFYDREIIWGVKNKGRPYNLNVHRNFNILFFSYSMNDIHSFVDLDFQLSSIDLDTRESQSIPGIRGGFAVTVNQHTDDIYLGGSDGIFKYNMNTKLADFYGEKGINIWSLFHNKNLFYISYPDQKLHIEVDGKFARVKEFKDIEVDQFHVTNEGLIYFANKSGLYFYDNVMNIKRISDLLTLRQIAEDADGTLYFCTNFGIHVIANDTDELKKVSDMKNIYGLAFDKDNNFIISLERYIVKLKKSDKGCFSNTHLW